MRLIDADKLNRKKKYSFQTVGLPFPKNEWFIKAADLFAATTIDAVPVVRCKECDKSVQSPLLGCGWRFCKNNGQHHKDEHFCSYGERKDGAEDV